MPKVQIHDDLEMFYELHGDGPHKVILIMGLNGSHLAWKRNVDDILSKHTEFQLLIFDNRGVGFSSSPEGRYTTSMMANDAKLLLDKLEWEKFHVVGVSMGGMIAQELCLLVPERVLSAAFTVTHFGAFGTLLPPFKGLSGVLKSMTTKEPLKRIPHLLETLFTQNFLNQIDEDGKTNREKEAQIMTDAFKALPPPNMAGNRSQVMAVNTHKVSEKRLQTLRNYPMEILVIGSTQDCLVAPKHSIALNEILKPSEFLMFESGHGVNVEHMVAYDEALVRNWKRAIQRHSLAASESQSEPKPAPDQSESSSPSAPLTTVTEADHHNSVVIEESDDL